MNDVLKVAGGLVAAAALVVGLAYGGFWLTQTFAPKYEEVRRTVYEESRAHVTGTNQHIGRLRLEYETAANDAHRQALRAAVLAELAEFPREHLTPANRAFVASLEGPR